MNTGMEIGYCQKKKKWQAGIIINICHTFHSTGGQL